MVIEKKIPVSRAILWILLSTLLVSGSTLMGWLYFLHARDRRSNDDQYQIVAIIQSTSQSDTLKTVYLAELLDLSLDKPVNLYNFNIQKATEKLLNHPLIKDATIKKILPGALYIDYEMRVPVAYLGELSNTAIDKDGYLFPVTPFFTPKNLPTLYLGINFEECRWGECIIQQRSVQQAFHLLEQWHHLFDEAVDLKQIDVSLIGADSYGQRQVVITLQTDEQKGSSSLIYLRLSSDHNELDLKNYYLFEQAMRKRNDLLPQAKQGVVLDFRIPNLAYIKPICEHNSNAR